mmetsp:Transcript_42171/g.82730  ORF Transcript_42171/g.82730 Transcript_42171/m.82730 type:complete len:321 (-) Transcript_42171:737-1699(-)
MNIKISGFSATVDCYNLQYMKKRKAQLRYQYNVQWGQGRGTLWSRPLASVPPHDFNHSSSLSSSPPCPATTATLTSSSSSSSPAYISSAICHTWSTLSSLTLATVQSSRRFQLKSDTLEVWPPCMKRSSGGPSSASSGDCSSPMRERSQTLTRRSAEQDPRTEELSHSTWNTWSVWPLRRCMGEFIFRTSHSPTVRSALPVTNRNSSSGLKARLLISPWCAFVILCVGLDPPPVEASPPLSIDADPLEESPGLRTSQSRMTRSSPTLPMRLTSRKCHETSSTTSPWPRKVLSACTSCAPSLMSKRHTLPSSPAVTRRPRA